MMLTRIIFAAFVLATLSRCALAQITYERNGEGQLTPITEGPPCTKPGSMCHNCTMTASCLRQQDGSFVKDLSDNCARYNATCSMTHGTCLRSGARNEACESAFREPPFRCQQPGIFPDPYNCTEYHLCAEEGDNVRKVTQTCPEGFYFDPKYLSCVSARRLNCTRPMPACTEVTQNALTRNRRMYFQCRMEVQSDAKIAYAPYVYYCPGNRRWTVDRCHDPDEDFNVDANGLCTQVGNFSTASSCISYNICPQIGARPRIVNCIYPMHFDAHEMRCVRFACDMLNL